MKKWLFIIGIIFTVVCFRFVLAPVLEQLELISYDLRAKLAVDSGPFSGDFKPADKNILIVSIDDFSRKELTHYPQYNLGSWPWRRDVWGEVVDYIEKDKPKAILFDLIFNDVNDGVPYDRKFGMTLRNYDNLVLATSLNNPKEVAENIKSEEIPNSDFLPTSEPLDVDMRNKKVDDNITFLSHAPIADRYTQHNMMAVVNKVTKKGSVIRTSQPIFKLVKNDETYYMPSLAFAGFLKAIGNDEKIVVKNNKIIYKGREIPIDNDGTTHLSWHGAGHDYPFLHVSDVVLGMHGKKEFKKGYFKDKIIIIGRTEAGTDIHASAVNQYYPGPEANATAIDNFLNDTDSNNEQSRKFLTELPVWAEYLLTIFFCVLLVFIGIASRSAFLGLLNSFLFVIFYVLMAVYAFADPDIRLWIPIAVPLYYIIVTSSVVYSFRLHSESAKKTEVMSMFGKFVSPSVLSQLMKTSEGLVIKSSRKPITIMFCDVKDFTTLSEKCNPEQLVENLNELFNEIVNIVFENNGTVDKFVGDCIMAYWGDPLASEGDAYMAVKTALEIKKKVNEMKITNTKEGKIVFDVKMGVNTGEALLGLAGSEKIMSYTAMGDAVNVASRLESSCSQFGKDILISKSTYEKVKNKIVALEVEKISLKGKDEKILVYEPIGFIEKPVVSAE